MFVYFWLKTRSWDYKFNIQVDFYATHFTRITCAKDFGEFLGTTKFYLKIWFTDFSSHIKKYIFKPDFYGYFHSKFTAQVGLLRSILL